MSGAARTMRLPLAIRLAIPHIRAMAPPKKSGFSEAPQAAWKAEGGARKKERPLKSARGTSMGGKGSARERAAVGLNPVPGVDMTLEEAEAYLATLKPEPAKTPARGRGPAGATELPAGGVTATVQALSRLIEEGRPEFRAKTWVPHRPPRPGESEGGFRVGHRVGPRAERRPAAGDRRARRRRQCPGAGPGAARRHRLGQNLHYGQ